MNEKFPNITKPAENLIFRADDPHDARLGELIAKSDYDSSAIVILGCPHDEGVRRSGGRAGAALAPDAIREQFYKLSPFGISRKICDLGNLDVEKSLEEIHDSHTETVKKILDDGKKLIILGGGGDISSPAGRAVAEFSGANNWLAINIDSRLDVRDTGDFNNENAFRRLLDEKLIRPDYFYEAAFQPHFAAPVYFRYLQNLGVNLISLDQLRSRESTDLELRELMRQKFINHSQSLSTFFGFDLSAVRASDAPGVSAPSPIGLRAGEFLNLVNFAAKLVNTRIIEFTEVNPHYDIDNRTTKLVAIAMHRFCSSV